MGTDFVFDLNGFDRDLDETLKKGRIAFRGKYKEELNALSGLSKDEIDSISPGITDLQTYDELIALVKAASRVNLEQSELKKRIINMGEIAVTIAGKIPSLAKILI